MDQESNIIRTVQINDANAAVVLNGSIFPLNSLTIDNVKSSDLSNEKFDHDHAETLTSQEGVILDSITSSSISNGIITLTVNNGAGGSLDTHLADSTSKDLQTVSIYTQEQLAAALNTAQLLEITGQARESLESIGDVSTLPATPVIFTPTIATNTLAATEHGYQIDTDKVKKKGGWPKGKKRKPSLHENAAPRAPMTGYVLYATNRRKVIKTLNPDWSFTCVTKLIGQEWSGMAHEDKQKYLDEAEQDKARYKEELNTYLKSDSYQKFLKRKKLRELCDGNSVDPGSLHDSELVMSDPEGEELYCRMCKQYFTNSHNKREHLLGRQHLQNITKEFEKEQLEGMKDDDSLDLTEDSVLKDSESLTDLNSSGHMLGAVNCSSSSEIDVNGFVTGFMQKNIDREKEIKELKKSFEANRLAHNNLCKNIAELKELEVKLESDLDNYKAFGAALSAQVDSLKMVPTLFGVINF